MPPTEEKIKIKLSELTDMYDIEDDTKHTPEKEDKKQDYDITIEEEDAKLEEEFDNE